MAKKEITLGHLEEAARKLKFSPWPFDLWSPLGRPILATASDITGKTDNVEALRGMAQIADARSGDVVVAVAIHELASNVAAERKATAVVALPGWSSVFYKTPGGDWHGEGGSYGPTTELGKKLEAALKEQQSSK